MAGIMMNSDLDILNAAILIVDDQAADVQLLEQMLRTDGYQNITSTLDPHAVVALHRDNRYDLILLDLQMPGMDGFQVMEALKKITTGVHLPVLVITNQPAHKLRSLQAGAKDFISKPFDLVETRLRIHNMLEVSLLYKQAKHFGHEMQSLALHDGLTGLANRRLLTDRISHSIVHARRYEHNMAVMYLDLDGFKHINDTLGHDAGDTLLCMVAARLLATVRQEDTVARLGGDEFAIALWDLHHAEDVPPLVSKVMQAMSLPYSIQGHDVKVTASIGVGIYPLHGQDIETLMKNADLSMYTAKHAGKNVYRIAT